jgi:hypothetical protein
MMRHQYRDTADHDALHGIEPEPEGPLLEHCPKHGTWQATRSIDECPACFERRQDLEDRRDAYWDRVSSHLDY